MYNYLAYHLCTVLTKYLCMIYLRFIFVVRWTRIDYPSLSMVVAIGRRNNFKIHTDIVCNPGNYTAELDQVFMGLINNISNSD